MPHGWPLQGGSLSDSEEEGDEHKPDITGYQSPPPLSVVLECNVGAVAAYAETPCAHRASWMAGRTGIGGWTGLVVALLRGAVCLAGFFFAGSFLAFSAIHFGTRNEWKQAISSAVRILAEHLDLLKGLDNVRRICVLYDNNLPVLG